MGASVTASLFSAVGNDMQGQICVDAVNKSHLGVGEIIRSDELRTGSCIVISGSDDRCFITDRGCVNDLSVSWFEEKRLLPADLDHIHVAGFYNCIKLASEAPEFFRKVLCCNSMPAL